jgi:tripartite-type tricarboxylate transporter receptor subunit TctC
MSRNYVARFFTLMLSATVLTAGALTSAVAAFPDQPIKFIMPWPPGGGSDIAMRLVTEALSKKIGQPVIVVNRPGAGGAIGIREIADAKPDGYTIGMIGSGAISAQYLNPNANALSELQPIALFGEEPAALIARADAPFKTLKEFVEAAQAKPGSIKNGNDQPGGAAFAFISLYEGGLKMKVQKVAYAGYAPAVNALLSGEVQTISIAVPDVAEHHKSGRVRILGVSGPERHFMVEDVPTFKEQGFDLSVGSWRSIAGPKGIPADHVKILEEKLVEVMRDPDFIARAKASGFIVAPGGVTETEKLWDAHDKMLYPILLEAGLVKARKKP